MTDPKSAKTKKNLDIFLHETKPVFEERKSTLKRQRRTLDFFLTDQSSNPERSSSSALMKYSNIPVKPTEYNVLVELESIFGQKLRYLESSEKKPFNSFGFTSQNQHITGLFLTKYSLRGFIPIEQFPSCICRLSSLQVLDLKFTNISSLPPSFGNLINITHLSLAHNQLQQIPQVDSTYNNDCEPAPMLFKWTIIPRRPTTTSGGWPSYSKPVIRSIYL